MAKSAIQLETIVAKKIQYAPSDKNAILELKFHSDTFKFLASQASINRPQKSLKESVCWTQAFFANKG